MVPVVSRLRHAVALARVLALVVLASITAPWAVICLPGAPGAMPCCAREEAGTPGVRACCGVRQTPPATPTRAAAALAALQAPAPLAATIAFAPTRITALGAAPVSRAVHVDVRLLNAVFLI